MEVLQEIDEAFTIDPDIDEIGLTYDPPSSSSHTVLIDHKLGIYAKSLKKLFKYASGELRKHVTCAAEHAVNLSAEDLHRLTRAVLIVRGDNPMALHLRKKLLNRQMLPLPAEISLLDMIFLLHPKSPSCWEHRRWILSRLHPHELSPSVVDREFQLCSNMADRYPRNYYAWIHRIWLLRKADSVRVREDERRLVREWIRLHPSDHSAVSYQLLLISEERSTDANAAWESIRTELAANGALLSLYAEHESLWLQRRYLLLVYLPHITDSTPDITSLSERITELVHAIDDSDRPHQIPAPEAYLSTPAKEELLRGEVTLCISHVSSKPVGEQRRRISKLCLRYLLYLLMKVSLHITSKKCKYCV